VLLYVAAWIRVNGVTTVDLTRTDLDFAHELDAHDELASFRNEFVIDDPNLIYLDGNSLGRLPKRTIEFMRHAIEQEWGQRLIRVWNDGWIDTPINLGAKIAKVVGAQPDEIVVTEATSINLFKLAVAALRAKPERAKIVSDVFNFPSDLYILQGLIDLLGGRHQLELIPSADTITITPGAVSAAIDGNTALVSLTHVAFKSAFMYDMATVTEQAHQAGALMLWDLSHSAGAVPVDLNRFNVDLAVGCTYKYLNGGPGAPAFLYVRRDLQNQLSQPIWGWLAAKDPFAFELDYAPAEGVSRYKVGTPPMLSMKAIEPAIDILLEAGIDRVRAKSIRQTDYLIFLAEQWLAPLGFTVGTPRQAELRGSHVSLRHPEAYRINRALIEAEPPAMRVIPDFREPDNIRLGVAPLYNTFTEIYQAIDRLRQVVEARIYKRYSVERWVVT
jgi:kynureninase